MKAILLIKVQRRETSGPGGAIRDVFMEEAAFPPRLKVDIGFGHLWRHFGLEEGLPRRNSLNKGLEGEKEWTS